ncbi:MAG: lectin, partial [Actinomycetota bacterium]
MVAVGANPSMASAAVQPDNILSAGETLRSGDEIHSPNGRYRLVMQTDSNLVLYDGDTALWASNTVGARGARLVVQHDSNVVVYRGNQPLWHTVTHG